MTRISEIIDHFESIAPVLLQESYDNSGLQVGQADAEIGSVLLTVDVTEAVIDEAVQKKCNLIIAHHPVIFSGLKKLTGNSDVERVIIKAVKNDIAIFIAHTNLDAAAGGVNAKICEKLGLLNPKVLQPISGQLKKLVTFIPFDAAEHVRESVFKAGAGHIGNYDWCGYNTEGTGSFRGSEDSNPFVGEKGKIHYEKEIRFETIFPGWLQKRIVQALIDSHPYEEVAYDIYPLENFLPNTGMGMLGVLPEPLDEMEFLNKIKSVFGSGCVKHTALRRKIISRVAVCGGSGSFLLKKAISERADFFISSDFKYHQFFDAEGKIVIVDVGHFESEQFTNELFYELLVKIFPKFAIRFSEVNTNPVSYF